MAAWAKESKIEGSMITFIADTFGVLTKGLKMELEHPTPTDIGLIGRSKRFTMIVKGGEIKAAEVSYDEADPFGADDPSATNFPNILQVCKSLNLN
mmetsp:Transcript_48419/g.94631  ORF Transcript_48419/g.94631 Transcript_48419/m.94631 type:complete len:96 (-) Transcript_48419:289-576(-)